MEDIKKYIKIPNLFPHMRVLLYKNAANDIKIHS